MTGIRSTLRRSALIGAAATSIIAAAPALAQDGPGRGWRVSLGGGVQAGPKYPGSDELGISPMPIFDLRRPGAPLTFEAPDEGSGFGFLGDDSPFDFGPAIQFQGKRREEDVGAPVGDVGFTVEAGGFAQVSLSENFRLRAEMRRGLGGHKGWVGDLSADLVIRDRDTYVFSIGPRARWSNDRYQDAYFGVPAAIPASGLAAYDPGGGFHAVGVVAGLTHMIDRDWGVYAHAGYDRLIGDAADSPLVRAFGSRDQFRGGIGLFYSFDFAPGRR